MTDSLTEPTSHELQLQKQAQEILAEMDDVLETSPSVALDREAPFGNEKEGSGVPLASPSDVGTP
eukprot:5305627-Pleurochrysis_carterae.AAC.1